MSLRGDLNLIAPRLRRYARALVGADPRANESADALVGAALRQVFVDGAIHSAADPEIEAYAALIELNRDHMRAAESGGAPCPGALLKTGGSYASGARSPERLRRIPVSSDMLSGALLALQLEEREVLLLIGLEGFSYARAARILRISRSILLARLGRAREKLPKTLYAQPSLQRPRPRPPHLRLVK